MDDATGGASTLAAARQVSQDMEDILENGGFRFKETVMSGYPLGKGEELRKVLGLRWDTEKDEICEDVKLNYGEKVKGALPQVTKRTILWRVHPKSQIIVCL